MQLQQINGIADYKGSFNKNILITNVLIRTVAVEVSIQDFELVLMADQTRSFSEHIPTGLVHKECLTESSPPRSFVWITLSIMAPKLSFRKLLLLPLRDLELKTLFRERRKTSYHRSTKYSL